jgi:hypothetical protein
LTEVAHASKRAAENNGAIAGDDPVPDAEQAAFVAVPGELAVDTRGDGLDKATTDRSQPWRDGGMRR